MDEESTSAVNEAEVTDTSTTDSAPVESAEEDQSDSDAVSTNEGLETGEFTSSEGLLKEDTEEETEESTDSEETDDDQPEAKDEPQSKGERRKEGLQDEIRDLVAQRNQLRTQVEQLHQQTYQVPSEQDLQDQVNPDTGEYYTAQEAKLIRLEQQMQLKDYTERVTEGQLTLSSEAQRALQDFPMFDESSPEYNPEIAAQVDAVLQQNLVVDPNTGQIIGSRISPYQLYKSYDVATKAAQKKAELHGKLQGQKSIAKMMSAADPTTGGRGAEKSFAKMSVQEKAEYLRKKGHDV